MRKIRTWSFIPDIIVIGEQSTDTKFNFFNAFEDKEMVSPIPYQQSKSSKVKSILKNCHFLKCLFPFPKSKQSEKSETRCFMLVTKNCQYFLASIGHQSSLARYLQRNILGHEKYTVYNILSMRTQRNFMRIL